MRFGFVLPWGDAATAAHLASVAEDTGWDAFFVWEGVWGIDAWMALTAAAMRTSHIKLGTMLTPVPRRRPWDLAGQVATLDNLSDGRVILGVGLGAPHDGWLAFEPDPGRRVRAELLDEGLDVLTGLLRGQPFSYSGRHYTVRPTEFFVPPPPVQHPHPPIWVVGGWPAPKSMNRVARWNGWLPNVLPHGTELTPSILREGVDYLRAAGAAEPFDVVVEGSDATAETVAGWAEAGANWWLEANWSVERGRVREWAESRLRQGPPRQ